MNYKRPLFYGLFFLFLPVLFVSCSKEDGPAPEPEPVASDTMFNRVITVLNFGEALPDNMDDMDDQAPVYYSLETNRPVTIDYKRTSRWDLSCSGIYRSFLGGNNGNDRSNLGYQGPGKGGICIVKKHFNDVIDIPPDSDFKTGSGLIGTDEMGAYGEGTGYYAYDFTGSLFGDGGFEQQHIAYVLQDTRTVILRTARGNYAKIRMLSLYKDLLDPLSWRRNSPHPYLSFQYVLAKAGSKTFAL